MRTPVLTYPVLIRIIGEEVVLVLSNKQLF
jgi:hypothetical protein